MAISRFPVEEGTILFFARAIGDPNPLYCDPAYAATTETGGIIAPPTYVQSGAQFDPENPLRPQPGKPWFGSGATPTGLPQDGSGSGGGLSAGLHAEQHFEYHRPLRVGDILSSTSQPGRRWEKQGRSGRLLFSESIVEYRDQNGEVVVTAKTVGVVTEGPVERKDH